MTEFLIGGVAWSCSIVAGLLSLPSRLLEKAVECLNP